MQWLFSKNTGEQLVKAQLHHDRRQHEERASALLANQNPGPKVDYLVPIIADGDTGHGGLSAVMKLVKLFVEVRAICCCCAAAWLIQGNFQLHGVQNLLYYYNVQYHRLEQQASISKIKSQEPRNADTWAARY